MVLMHSDEFKEIDDSVNGLFQTKREFYKDRKRWNEIAKQSSDKILSKLNKTKSGLGAVYNNAKTVKLTPSDTFTKDK
jgi:hypothetical protein